MTLDEINSLPSEAFVDAFGGIYEHSPWVAEAALSARPYDDVDHMLAVMDEIVVQAPEAQRLALLRAHPELAGKAAIDGTLTDASQEEQASAGLDRLLPDEFEHLTKLNTAYQDKFGFPFIICVKLATKAVILTALEQRLGHKYQAEFETALGEVSKIVRLRLEGMIS